MTTEKKNNNVYFKHGSRIYYPTFADTTIQDDVPNYYPDFPSEDEFGEDLSRYQESSYVIRLSPNYGK